MYYPSQETVTRQNPSLRRLDSVREELCALEETLKEGEEKLSRLKEIKSAVEALSALTKEEILAELLCRIAHAERDYEQTVSAIEARSQELKDILLCLRKGVRP